MSSPTGCAASDAPFAVYRNKNPRTRGTYPLLVDVQVELPDTLHTRVVVPLTRASALLRKPLNLATPVVKIDRTAYLFVTPLVAGVAKQELGAVAGSVADQRREIVAAFDFLITGI